MNKIFIASKNNGKIEEIKFFLENFNFEIFSYLDYPNIPDVEETGKTFEENAVLKAKTIYRTVNIPVLADDSGLEVDILNGAPGVFSARYSGNNASDSENNEKLLNELQGMELNNRSARFKCVIVYYDGVSEKVFEGICDGHIAYQPSGDKGFGYDPLFIPAGFKESFADLGPEVKNKISHRAKALFSFRKFLDLERNM